jgi:tripartite-type tricarboxylate transporter receptor subunit TctC
MKLSGLALFLAAMLVHAANAQDTFPSKSVRIIAASPATSGDLLARQLALKLGESWKQMVIVENRAGAGGVLAAEFASKGTPDGYTLHLGQLASFGAAPSLIKRLSYDPQRNFQPITRYAELPQLIIAHPSIPATTLKELIAATKNPGSRLSYASGGAGTSGHLTLELLKNSVGINLLHIPYRGVGAATTAVISGEVQLAVIPVPVAIPQVKAGKVKAYAITSRKRFSLAPDIPTASEAGLPAFEATTWFAMFAPALTPQPIIKRLNKDMVNVISAPEMTRWLGMQGAEPTPSTPAELASFLADEISKWARVIKTAGITAD